MPVRGSRFTRRIDNRLAGRLREGELRARKSSRGARMRNRSSEQRLEADVQENKQAVGKLDRKVEREAKKKAKERP